jgi:hypothetical protein
MVADAKTKRKYKEQNEMMKRLSKSKNGAVAELKLK